MEEAGHIATRHRVDAREGVRRWASGSCAPTQSRRSAGRDRPVRAAVRHRRRAAEGVRLLRRLAARCRDRPGTRYTPYSAYRWGRDVSVGERIAMEIVMARDAGRLERRPDVADHQRGFAPRGDSNPWRSRRRAVATPRTTVVILDFGSQESQLIARRTREAQRLLASCCPTTHRGRRSRQREPAAIILSGGPESTLAPGRARLRPPEVFTSGMPMLGICYGMQLIAQESRRRARSARARRVRTGDADRRRGGLPAVPRRPAADRACGCRTATRSTEAAAGLRRATPTRSAAAVAAIGDRGAPDLRRAVPSRSRSHRSRERRSSRTFSIASPGSRRRGRWTRSSTRRSSGFARKSATPT